ncbi:MAG: cytidylate kinase [Syntrophorhabdus sp. PtaB.Bin047]|jgi:cytidylate kinase|nr:MAG: cytidylate kinase [Syntrophorhabdus sp. PtaB.Bin047]
MGIITISRTHGSGGTTFARELAKQLGYSYIDRALINDECLESNRHTCSFGIDEGTAPGLHVTTQELMADANFYKVSFIANILDHALRDDVVMAGMGAGIILAGISNAINIRVVRLMEERVRAIARVKSIPYDDAFDLVERMDEGKRDFIGRYFDADPGDPSYYHAVVNSSYVSLKEAVGILAEYARRHFTDACAREAEEVLGDRLLERRAEILLFQLGMGHCFRKVIFQAGAEGTLSVAGVVRNEAEKDRLLGALAKDTRIRGIRDSLETGVFEAVS